MALSTKEFKNRQREISEKRLKSKKYPKELTIVAEGDSWFDYPFKKDILDYLIKKGYAIKKFSQAGDTLENMIYGSKYNMNGNKVIHLGQLSLQETLTAVRKHKPKFVLFSGGGNDIVGSEILNYLNHKYSRPNSLVNKKIFKVKLERMQAAIEFFIKSIKRTNPESHIIMDGYDYAKVNGKGYVLVFKWTGPWILPSMGKKAIVLKDDQKEIVRYLVDKFNEMLMKLDEKYSYFHHIDLRGKFPNEREWDNEIHLKSKGYKKVANLYHDKITEILNQDPIEVYEDKLIV